MASRISVPAMTPRKLFQGSGWLAGCGCSWLMPRLPLAPVLASGGSLRFAPSVRVSLRSSLAIVCGSPGILSEQRARRPGGDHRTGDHHACAAEPFALVAGLLDERRCGLD